MLNCWHISVIKHMSERGSAVMSATVPIEVQHYRTQKNTRKHFYIQMTPKRQLLPAMKIEVYLQMLNDCMRGEVPTVSERRKKGRLNV